MAYDQPPLGTLKRKRRRRDDKPAISARLYLDSNLKGEVGVLSEDLVQDLFPGTPARGDTRLYSAVTPWTPNPSVTDSTWSVLPFRTQAKDEKPLPPSTIRFPASASGTQSFVNVVQALLPNRTIRQNAGVEVRISDVVPLALETVYVSIDGEAINKLEEVKKRYGGGFQNANGYNNKRASKEATTEGKADAASVEDVKRRLVNEALAKSTVIHTGDMMPLAISHPVTHTSAPPAKILACEPVSQGILVPTTKIVITSATEKRSAPAGGNRQLLSPRLAEESGEDDDTSNEAFFSATEEGSPAKPIVTSKSTTDLSNTDDLFDTSAEDSNLSDDSDDMISMVKPGLTDRPSGLSSAFTSATPRPFGNRTNGMGTPGSVFSHVTASTMRGGQSTKTKVFRAQGLLEHIAEELLHPKPAGDEDEEARVYVDSTALARLGCFSGDWVKIEPAESLLHSKLGAALASLTESAWRPVKVYSLPESMAKPPPRYQLNNRSGRRDSISSLTTNSTSVATLLMSPILLANLNSPENVSLSPLSAARRTALKRPLAGRPGSVSSRLPPTASEVTLRKIITPLSNERALNNVLFANLKEYFERKQRILKSGDIIAIPIDESLGRSLYEGGVEQDESSSDALLSQWNAGMDQNSSQSNSGPSNVAWFTIEAVNVTPGDESDTEGSADMWSGAASIDPKKMTMRQSGDERRRLPSASNNPWPYYLGVKKAQAQISNATGAVAPSIPEQPRHFVSSLQRRLRELISVSISPRAVHLGLPPVAILLTSTQRNIGKAYTVEQTCADLGIHYFPIDAHDIASEGGAGVDVQAQGLLEARCERALDCGSDLTAICIKHVETLSSDRVAASLKTVLEDSRVLVATTTDIDKVSDAVRGLFTHELEMSAPDEREREGILRDIVTESGIPLAPEVDLASIAVKTAALVAGDLEDVVDRAVVARVERLNALATAASANSAWPVTTKDIKLSGGAAAKAIVPADFDAAVDLARKNFADAIGAPKIPNVQWSDVGGLTNVKDAVIETIQLPLSRPELFAKGLKKRSGILFYGPPGTGKTLLAKAIATEFSLNFFSVKGPELLNMYIGESEANVRRVFQRARDARPCVVFFDELDSVAPKRGNQGDSGGVMDRIVSQLLAELDGMSDGEESGGGVFVIGATNRPDLLDQALLRPGRFDKMLYLGISDTHDKQATILQALTRKFDLHPDLSLPRVAESLPFTFTGADLYALCSDAMLKAVTRSARLVDEKVNAVNSERAARGATKISVGYYFDHYAQESDSHVSVVEEDFLQAKSELVPSVSVDELQHYETVRATFEGKAKSEANGAEEEQPPRPPTGQSGHSASGSVSGSDQPIPRAKLKDFMKRATSSYKDRFPTLNGNGRSSSPDKHMARRPSDTDDDYVVRTERMSMNGAPSRPQSSGGSARPQSSKGKGKGKAREPSVPEAKLEDVGEDLYD